MKRLAIVMLLSCGGGFKPTGSVAPTRTSEVPTRGAVAVEELGDTVFSFTQDSVVVTRGRKIVLRGDAPTRDRSEGGRWKAASTIAAPEGGRWVVGISAGSLWRIDPAGPIEHVDERLGVLHGTVLAVASEGTTSVIGLVGGMVVSNDGVHVMRFDGEDATAVAAARGRVAIATARGISVLDLSSGSKINYDLTSASDLAFRDAGTDHPTLLAIVDGSIYEEAQGALRKLDAPSTNQIAVSESRMWLLAHGSLFTREGDHQVVAAKIDANQVSQIHASRSGAVWVTPKTGDMVRFAVDKPEDDPAWHRVVEPIFKRVCASCHLPGGDADLDLSSLSAWTFERPELVQRVVIDRTMPPAGTELTDEERNALAGWLQRTP